jgi:hypothetical protein
MDYELTIRNTREEYYEMLKGWWGFWKFPAPPQEMLPDNGRNGIIVQNNGIDVIAGFIYATSSPSFFHFEWVISNPDVKDRELRKQSKHFLINKASEFIKRLGGKAIYVSLKNPSLINDFEDCGFIKGSTSCVEMVKSLY